MAKIPELEIFCEKLKNSIKASGSSDAYTQKWGMGSLDEIFTILDNNYQGGYASHKCAILSTETGSSVLDVGPGMGYCVFMLAEIYDQVFVAEPDADNCKLIEKIASKYVTEDGRPASEIVNCINAGINITDEAVKYWELKRKMLSRNGSSGGILNYTVKGAQELEDVFQLKVDRIYLHKVMSSLSISNNIQKVIDTLMSKYISQGGTLSWTEPAYIFSQFFEEENMEVISKKIEANDPVKKQTEVLQYDLNYVNKGIKEVSNWVSFAVKNGKH